MLKNIRMAFHFLDIDMRKSITTMTRPKLINNLEETDRKDLILRRKGEAQYLREHKKKLQKRIWLNDTKKYSFLKKKYRYLEWTKGRSVDSLAHFAAMLGCHHFTKVPACDCFLSHSSFLLNHWQSFSSDPSNNKLCALNHPSFLGQTYVTRIDDGKLHLYNYI